MDTNFALGQAKTASTRFSTTSLVVTGVIGVVAGAVAGMFLFPAEEPYSAKRLPEVRIPLKHRFYSDPGANIIGTSRQGRIRTTYAKIARAFGRPGKGDGYKTHYEWTIRDGQTGKVMTIYDYKEGDTPPGRNQMIEWSVGGNHGADVNALAAKIRMP